MKLAMSQLAGLRPDIAVPAYDRAALSHGIVHVGLGNFHRAHQAVYLDDLFNKGLDHDWAITGAGVRAPDAGMREKLAAQDYLSTVIELDADETRARIVGAMIDFVPVQEGNAALIAKMADPETRIVALTVTEGGYFVSAETGTFDPDSPERVAAVRADGQHVFVNFTAAWCITCLVNEQVVFSDAEVRAAFEDGQVAYVKADWTNRDPMITEALARYERAGVPLYLLYPAGGAGEAGGQVLPQILTPSAFLNALKNL